MSRTLARLARACARHPWRTVGAWILALFAIASFASSLGGEYVDDFRLPGSDAQKAIDQLEVSFPEQAGGSARLVFSGNAPLAGGPHRAAIDHHLAEIGRLPNVTAVGDPFTDGTVSPAGTVAYAAVSYDTDVVAVGRDGYEALADAVRPLRDQGLGVEIGGSLAVWEQSEEPGAEQIGLVVAALVLLFAFGSVVAMLLPIGLALFALVVGQALILALAATTNVPSSAASLTAMIGLGVGIDYALFIVTRFRELRHAGTPIVDAIGRASATAGVAVLFAGFTVMIAISGLLLSGIWAIGVLGLASALVVAVTVVAALTLLPALLGLVGRWIDKFRVPHFGRRADAGRGWSWRWAHGVTRRPVAAAVIGTAVLAAPAVPLFDMRLGQNDQGSQPENTSQRRAYDLLAEGFGPGFNGPLLMVATVPDDASRAKLEELRAVVAATPGIAAVSPATYNADGDVAVFDAMPTTSPQDKRTADLVDRLRDEDIPGVTDGTSLSVLVSGNTAGFVDLSRQMADRLPTLIASVIFLSFVLLMIAFRSVLIPLKAAVMNLMSVAAAYGVIVAVFQWGWGKGVFGLSETIPVVSWVPMLMFAILFGLSMDYEVFLLSRIRDEYVRTRDTKESVASGLAGTARVITAAALIMIAVFLAFVASPDPVVKMVGLGLAVAVFIDATVVRMVLVPSLMVLMGQANWWLPRWLERILPTIHLDDAEDIPAPGSPLPPPTEPARELVSTGSR